MKTSDKTILLQALRTELANKRNILLTCSQENEQQLLDEIELVKEEIYELATKYSCARFFGQASATTQIINSF